MRLISGKKIINHVLAGLCIQFLSGYTLSQVLPTIKAKTKVEILAKANSSWDGSVLPDYPAGRPEITILKIIIPPKVSLPLHKHPVINAGVLLKGKLTIVTDDNKVLRLGAGDSIVEVVDKWHYGKNESDDAAEIIVFYAGVQNNPITLKQ